MWLWWANFCEIIWKCSNWNGGCLVISLCQRQYLPLVVGCCRVLDLWCRVESGGKEQKTCLKSGFASFGRKCFLDPLQSIDQRFGISFSTKKWLLVKLEICNDEIMSSIPGFWSESGFFLIFYLSALSVVKQHCWFYIVASKGKLAKQFGGFCQCLFGTIYDGWLHWNYIASRWITLHDVAFSIQWY